MNKNEPQQKSKFVTLSARQQILYLLSKTQENNDFVYENSDEDIKIEYKWMDFYKETQEQVRNSIPKQVSSTRNKLHKESQKEYVPIKKNIYIERKKEIFNEDDAFICSCVKPNKSLFTSNWYKNLSQYNKNTYFGCGKDCINRLIFWECVENICPWGSLCQNKRFQNNETVEIYPLKTLNKGWGLFAGQFIPKGSFIVQYIGEIYYLDSQYGERKLKEYQSKNCTYLMSISNTEVIDPTYKGNIARFINHSCDPNCETQKWYVQGEICIGVFSIKDIRENEELTFNYGFDLFKTIFQKCYCGSFNCKGYLGLVQPEQSNIDRNDRIEKRIKCGSCLIILKNNELLDVCILCKKIYHKVCFMRSKNGACEACFLLENQKNEKEAVKKNEKEGKKRNSLMLIGNEEFDLNEKKRKMVSKKRVLVGDGDGNELKEFDDKEKEKDEEKKENELNLNESNEKINEFDYEKANKDENNLQMKSVEGNKSNVIKKLNDSFRVNNSNQEEDISKDKQEQDQTKLEHKPSSNNNLPHLKQIEYEEVLPITKSTLQYIKQNLKSLIKIGARLFWENKHSYHSTLNTDDTTIDLKVKGTSDQIHLVKESITDYMNNDQNKYIKVKYELPKTFLRKVFGHQHKNLNGYKVKHQVEFEFDSSCISDEIYSITDFTSIVIKGLKPRIDIIINEINDYLSKLRVFTMKLLYSEYQLIKNHICFIKNKLNPSDIRLEKWENFKFVEDKEITKSLIIIGFEHEITSSKNFIKEFILKQCCLKPSYALNLNLPKESSEDVRQLKDFLQTRLSFFSKFSSDNQRFIIIFEGKWNTIKEGYLLLKQALEQYYKKYLYILRNTFTKALKERLLLYLTGIFPIFKVDKSEFSPDFVTFNLKSEMSLYVYDVCMGFNSMNSYSSSLFVSSNPILSHLSLVIVLLHLVFYFNNRQKDYNKEKYRSILFLIQNYYYLLLRQQAQSEERNENNEYSGISICKSLENQVNVVIKDGINCNDNLTIESKIELSQENKENPIQKENFHENLLVNPVSSFIFSSSHENNHQNMGSSGNIKISIDNTSQVVDEIGLFQNQVSNDLNLIKEESKVKSKSRSKSKSKSRNRRYKSIMKSRSRSREREYKYKDKYREKEWEREDRHREREKERRKEYIKENRDMREVRNKERYFLNTSKYYSERRE